MVLLFLFSLSFNSIFSMFHQHTMRDPQGPTLYMPERAFQTLPSVHLRGPRRSETHIDEMPELAAQDLPSVDSHSRTPSDEMNLDKMPMQKFQTLPSVRARGPKPSEMYSVERQPEVITKEVSKKQKKKREQKREKIFEKMGKDIYRMFTNSMREILLLGESYNIRLAEIEKKSHKKMLELLNDLDFSAGSLQNFLRKSKDLKVKHENDLEKLEMEKSQKEKFMNYRLKQHVKEMAETYHISWRKYYQNLQNSVPERYQVDQLSRAIKDEIESLKHVFDETDRASEIQDLYTRLKNYMEETLHGGSARLMHAEGIIYDKMCNIIKKVGKSGKENDNKILMFTCVRDYTSSELLEKCRYDRTVFFLMPVKEIIDLYGVYKAHKHQ